MLGLMMDYQLNVPAILRRADELYGDREIVSRLPDKSWHRFTYADFVSRTKRLAVALRGLGLDDGDRVATLMWNHHEHLETYVGAPVGGFVTHTLNLRLHPDDNTYIASHAGDRVLVVDKVLWPLAAQFVDRVGFEHVVALGGGDVLHERHHGPAEGRPLLASRDRAPRPHGRVPPRRERGGHDPARRADVPRERVVLPVHLLPRRSEAGVPGAAPRPREPPRGIRAGEGDPERGRAHDLDGHPPGARRDP